MSCLASRSCIHVKLAGLLWRFQFWMWLYCRNSTWRDSCCDFVWYSSNRFDSSFGHLLWNLPSIWHTWHETSSHKRILCFEQHAQVVVEVRASLKKFAKCRVLPLVSELRENILYSNLKCQIYLRYPSTSIFQVGLTLVNLWLLSLDRLLLGSPRSKNLCDVWSGSSGYGLLQFGVHENGHLFYVLRFCSKIGSFRFMGTSFRISKNHANLKFKFNFGVTRYMSFLYRCVLSESYNLHQEQILTEV